VADVIDNSKMNALTVPERFSAYAHAYLRAASRMCQHINRDPLQYGFPDASVVLLLATHSVELFLKGAILKRNPCAQVGHHRLTDLHHEFDRLFPEPECRWELPFETEYIGFTEMETALLSKRDTPPSIRFRYPTNSEKKPWSGIHVFQPEMFARTLMELEQAYAKIEKIL